MPNSEPLKFSTLCLESEKLLRDRTPFHSGCGKNMRLAILTPVVKTLRNRSLPILACPRLSDSGEEAKVKGTRKVGGGKKKKWGERELHSPCSPQFPPVLFSCSRVFNSAGATISEPGTGYIYIQNLVPVIEERKYQAFVYGRYSCRGNWF